MTAHHQPWSRVPWLGVDSQDAAGLPMRRRAIEFKDDDADYLGRCAQGETFQRLWAEWRAEGRTAQAAVDHAEG